MKPIQAAMLMAIFFLLTACVNRIDEEEIPGETTSLKVETRAGSTPLPYLLMGQSYRLQLPSYFSHITYVFKRICHSLAF